jgi:hypothetical protein
MQTLRGAAYPRTLNSPGMPLDTDTDIDLVI